MKNIFILIVHCMLFLSFQSQAQPQFYGSTAHNGGAIYKYDAATKSLTTVYNYKLNEVFPVGDLLQATNGKLYGMATNGGINNTGAIFVFDPATNVQTKLAEFNTVNGASPTGYFVQGKSGTLYGTTTYGGANGNGVIFSFNPVSHTLTKLYDFGTTGGANPIGGLVVGTDGKLYGLAYGGGLNEGGVIYSFDVPKKKFTKLHDFDFENGAYPSGNLTLKDGKFYGVTKGGGLTDAGVLFTYDAAKKTYATLYHFDYDASTGAQPAGSLTLGKNGLLYGNTEMGGVNDEGVIYSFDVAKKKYAKLYSFKSSTGAYPAAGLQQGANGKFYGMTRGGGPADAGVLFSFDATKKVYTALQYFDEANGAYPGGGLTKAGDGKFYGAPTYGGGGGYGVIFSFDPASNIYAKLKDFDYAADGAFPVAALTHAADGKYYGTTVDGGNKANGVIFSFDPLTATYKRLYDFSEEDGSYHNGDLLSGSNGLLYGFTNSGGSTGTGIIFSFNPQTAAYNKLYDFDNVKGAYPSGSLIAGANGLYYGVSFLGGANYEGVIFSFDPATAAYTSLHDFAKAEGANPVGGLTMGLDGKFYGMTNTGGAAGKGVLFSFDPILKKYKKLKDFSGADGETPFGKLTLARDGKLYGMTHDGGSEGNGIVFSFDPTTAGYATVYSFDKTAGAHPYGSLVLASDGKLYGSAYDGGANNYGVIFTIDPATKTYSTLTDFDGVKGGNPSYGSLTEYCAQPGVFYRDADGDGWGNAAIGALSACAAPPGYVQKTGDCNDADENAHPEAVEICGNGKDDNCNGKIDEDCNQINYIVVADTAVNETDGKLAFAVKLTSPAAAPVTVYYYTFFGTATPGADYFPAISSLTIPAGSANASVNIKIIKDAAKEADEYFELRFSNAKNAVLKNTRARITIKDGGAAIAGTQITAKDKLLLAAYPNPSSRYFSLMLTSKSSEPVALTVTDGAGNIIDKRMNIQPYKTFELGHGFKPGVYFAHLTQGGQKTTITLVKRLD